VRLESEAKAWSKSQRLRAYADAVERGAIDGGLPVEPGTEIYRWLGWARACCFVLIPSNRQGVALTAPQRPSRIGRLSQGAEAR